MYVSLSEHMFEFLAGESPGVGLLHCVVNVCVTL